MKCSLLIMSKSPVLGCVKTRMQPHLNQEQSLRLHIALTQYCLEKWSVIDGLTPQLWIGGDVENFRSRVLFPMGNKLVENYSLRSQPEGDLGERMLFAVNSTFNCVEQGVKTIEDEYIILVGTDCPFIDKDYLALTRTELEVADVVIGPATDGGYVLIAMKKSHSALFDNISWGSSSVLKQTQSILQQENLESVLLPPLPDIDVVGDLNNLEGYEEFADYIRPEYI